MVEAVAYGREVIVAGSGSVAWNSGCGLPAKWVEKEVWWSCATCSALGLVASSWSDWVSRSFSVKMGLAVRDLQPGSWWLLELWRRRLMMWLREEGAPVELRWRLATREVWRQCPMAAQKC